MSVSPGVLVRRARRQDAVAMHQLAQTAYQPYVARIGRPPAPMTADYAAVASSAEAWVAEKRGRLVGLLVLKSEGDHLLLENVAVAPKEQGLGIGDQLLRLAEEQAREHGLAEVRLYTNEAMTENLNYYLRHGFRETGRAEQDGFHRIFFTKHVSHPRHPDDAR